MLTKKIENTVERDTITALIVNDHVLGKVASRLRKEKHPFRSKWANEVAVYCFEFHAKFGKAPRAAVRTWFYDYSKRAKDEDTVDLMGRFLSSLDEDYQRASRELNPDFVVDRAAKLITEIRVERLRDTLDDSLSSADLDTAVDKLGAFHKADFASDDTIDVLTDREALADAFTFEESEILIPYPGPLGQFFGDQLSRDNFVAYLAPEKRGKSYWLIDGAWRAAVLERRRTKFYSVGDMTSRQMMRRFGRRAMGRPIEAETIYIPTDIYKTGEGTVRVESDQERFRERVKMSEVMEGMERVLKKTAHKDSLLRLKCVPNSTMSIADIDADIQDEIRNGFVPDVVVIDYMDILAPEPGSKQDDARHRINENWKAARSFRRSTTFCFCPLPRPTLLRMIARRMTRKNFSEDKRKIAHVTGMPAINQTDEEKRQGVVRINWVALREAHYTESNEVTVAGELAIANPAMLSKWL
jgi:hypothetical protein